MIGIDYEGGLDLNNTSDNYEKANLTKGKKCEMTKLLPATIVFANLILLAVIVVPFSNFLNSFTSHNMVLSKTELKTQYKFLAFVVGWFWLVLIQMAIYLFKSTCYPTEKSKKQNKIEDCEYASESNCSYSSSDEN